MKEFSDTPTLLLLPKVNDLLKQRAARFHIRSILPLDVTTDQLLASIWAIVAGLAVTLELSLQEDDEHTGWIANDELLVEEPLREHLTARETVVLRLMALGHGNKEIASRLDISEHTAKFHVSSVLAKLGAASRTEAVTIGIMRGLVAI
jgi:DNA-binding NarL/FixJ family response regulator